MILIDTHVWVWWVHADPRLSTADLKLLDSHVPDGIGVSAISCWEVAKLVELGRLDVGMKVEDWLAIALEYPGVRLLPLTPAMCVESTRLVGFTRKDPADQLIIASARISECSLMTADAEILKYQKVKSTRVGV